jgi:Uma2 family endonuclease
MPVTTTTRPITAEELWAMPNNERRELVRGEVRTMAPPGFDRGAVSHNVARLIGNHVADHRLGVVVGAETGFVLARNPDVVRGADAAFVVAGRIPSSGRPTRFWEGPPDLAIEVVSPSDTLQEVEEKVDDYLAAGTRRVWVVNPKRRTVTVYRPGAQPEVLREADGLAGEDVLPGFRCPVAALFG